MLLFPPLERVFAFLARWRRPRSCNHQWTQQVISADVKSGSYRQSKCARCGEIRVYSDHEADAG